MEIGVNRSRTLALWAICGLVLVPILQLLPLQMELLLSGKPISYWTLSNKQVASLGKWRYIKDLYFLGFAFLWPLLLLKGTDRKLTQMLFVAIGIELAIFCLGILGHIKEPNPGLIAAGIRWLMVLHCAIGAGFLVVRYRLLQTQESIVVFKWLVSILLIVNFAYIFTQRWELGLERFTGLRLNGMFANAITLAQYISGICLLLQILPMTMKQRNSLFLLALATIILSGTRGGIIIVIFAWLMSLTLMQFRKLAKFVWLLWPLLILVILFLIQIADHVAGRGNLLQQTKEGRFYLLYQLFFNSVPNFPAFDLFFGKGFGQATNTGHILSPGQTILIDNAFATWFLQMGVVGIIALLFGVVLIGYFGFRNSRLEYQKRVALYTMFFSLLVLAFQQNFVEQHGFMVFLGIVMGFVLNRPQQQSESTAAWSPTPKIIIQL